MQATFDRDAFELMNIFEHKTHAKAVDVVIDGDNVVFIVQEGDIGKAIGKGGSTLLRLREAFKPRNVEVIEDALDVNSMVEKTLRGATIRKITNENGQGLISVDPTTRGIAIGKSGSNIKKLKAAMKRKFGIEDTKIL